ncbi:MAG: NAD(P)/FAD-dependent oxidoreductase [Patescibacteria group bacterium]|jgi:flavin-dependent dehydrogenase
MENFDVLIVGASFSGLTLAHHLPKHLKVLVVDAKPSAGSTVESTGLITSKTLAEFSSFFPIDRYITNPISAIGVIAPGFADYFISTVKEPWIYQTDTKGLVAALAETLPANVSLKTSTVFLATNKPNNPTEATIRTLGQEPEAISIKFLVGADGGHSKVASTNPALSQNSKFLFGYEQVFFGDVLLGPKPEETIFHYWFGEFSLGYGGWLSPTVVDGRKAFRIGLAKLMKDRGEAKNLMESFMRKLVELGHIRVEGEITAPGYVFGSHIPIGGPRMKIADGNILLIGDAAGFCGAFAADGIKGSVISGKEAARVIHHYLDGRTEVTKKLRKWMNEHGGIMKYYYRQMGYRMIWDLMKTDRSFRAMYDIIASEHETFLEQFCDSKDKHRSLAWTVLKPRHFEKLGKYAWYIICDFIK